VVSRVRFHLGAGEHCGHWQIRTGERVEYVDPCEASLELRGCRLVNRPGLAKRIHDGANKTPCAWIECDSVLTRPCETQAGEPVQFNPRVAPHWLYRGRRADGMEFAVLKTSGRNVHKATGEHS
jgi:hypothetical protein